MSILAISGKLGSGKDTVGLIIQYLQTIKNYPNDEVGDFIWFSNMTIVEQAFDSKYKIKKFADKLKDITCLLIGCTREQLEDRDFKEKELGEEWWYYRYGESLYNYNTEKTLLTRVMNSEFLEPCTEEDLENCLIKLTPRKLLQLLGTDCGRQIIHPNIWVNALFSGYKNACNKTSDLSPCTCYRRNDILKGVNIPKGTCQKFLPNWIITDMRFPNELKVVKDRNGITIRVNRKAFTVKHSKTGENFDLDRNAFIEHSSETALDNAEFDYVIDNNGTIEELIEKVRKILVKEGII